MSSSRAWPGSLVVVVTVGALVVACSSSSAYPPELGDCVKVGDAGCSAPDPGGGSGGPSSGDAGGSDVLTGEGGTCGVAQESFTTNTTCAPCIEGVSGAGCCGADTACSAASGCISLLQCMLGCQATNVTCADNCENTYPEGVQAYNDFASCLSANCSPECPTLPQGGVADF